MGFSFPQPQREIQSVDLSAGTLGLVFWPGVRQFSQVSMLSSPSQHWDRPDLLSIGWFSEVFGELTSP